MAADRQKVEEAIEYFEDQMFIEDLRTDARYYVEILIEAAKEGLDE